MQEGQEVGGSRTEDRGGKDTPSTMRWPWPSSFHRLENDSSQREGGTSHEGRPCVPQVVCESLGESIGVWPVPPDVCLPRTVQFQASPGTAPGELALPWPPSFTSLSWQRV